MESFSIRMDKYDQTLQRILDLLGQGNVTMTRGTRLGLNDETPVPGITPDMAREHEVPSALANTLKPVTYSGDPKDPHISTWLESVETWMKCLRCKTPDQKFFLLLNVTSRDAHLTVVHNRKHINEAAPDQRWDRIKEILTSRFGPDPATQQAQRHLLREKTQTRHEDFKTYANKANKENQQLDPPLTDIEMRDILSKGIFWPSLKMAITATPVPDTAPLQTFITDVITKESGLRAAGVLETSIFSTPPPSQNQHQWTNVPPTNQCKRRAETPFPPSSNPPAPKSHNPRETIERRNQNLIANGRTIIEPAMKSFCKANRYCWWCKGPAHDVHGKIAPCPHINSSQATPLNQHQERQFEQ